MSIQLKRETFSVVHTPALDAPKSGVLYPRVIELNHQKEGNGVLLCTFEQRSHETPVFPIYRSVDSGASWELFSQVEDTKNGWGMRYQPHLFEVPAPLGDLQEGDLLCAGSSIPQDMSVTQLQLYVSRDGGKTWTYRSTIVTGGVAKTDPEPGVVRPVWEPYLYLSADGQLVVYYSDERFQESHGYNQLLSHQVSPDGGVTWGEEVFDVAIPGGRMRPGMPIVLRLPNGRYLMIYEMVGLKMPYLYGRFSSDGLDWGDPSDMGFRLQTEDGFSLASTPYMLWTPKGGPNGTILVSGRTSSLGTRLEMPGWFLANDQNGEGPWKKVEMINVYDGRIHACGYSQAIITAGKESMVIQVSPVQMNRRGLCQVICGTAVLEEE